MLQIKGLTVTHKKDLKVIIKDFSFVLNEGDKAVLIGEEGNGKSTILKLICREEETDYVSYEGEINRGGMKLGYLPQELSAEDAEKTVYDYLAEEGQLFLLTPKELSRLSGRLGVSGELFYSDQKMGTAVRRGKGKNTACETFDGISRMCFFSMSLPMIWIWMQLHGWNSLFRSLSVR